MPGQCRAAVPAYAGVSPILRITATIKEGRPRLRGGEPNPVTSDIGRWGPSPPTRG